MVYQNHIFNPEDFLNFTNQNGITGNFDAASGVLSLTGSTTLTNYTTALASVEYEKTGISSIKTRRATFVAFDGTDNSTGFVSFLDISGVNQAPVIVDDGNDTIFVSTNEDTLIDICLVGLQNCAIVVLGLQCCDGRLRRVGFFPWESDSSY